MEIVVQILGMVFVGIIIISLAFSVVSYIVHKFTKDNNKLEENIKRFEKQNR